MNITAHLTFEDADHDQAVVRVTTSRCFYSVSIEGLRCTVVGPGVEREFSFEGGGDMLMFEDISYKGLAIIAVTLLEEEE
jgi:hypothetical protein